MQQIPHTALLMPSLSLLTRICSLAAKPSYLTGLHQRLAQRGIAAAVRDHNTPALFGWLVEVLRLQGISDAAALTFMDQHGRASWETCIMDCRANPAARS
jgi:hypothetical protein